MSVALFVPLPRRNWCGACHSNNVLSTSYVPLPWCSRYCACHYNDTIGMKHEITALTSALIVVHWLAQKQAVQSASGCNSVHGEHALMQLVLRSNSVSAT